MPFCTAIGHSWGQGHGRILKRAEIHVKLEILVTKLIKMHLLQLKLGLAPGRFWREWLVIPVNQKPAVVEGPISCYMVRGPNHFLHGRLGQPSLVLDAFPALFPDRAMTGTSGKESSFRPRPSCHVGLEERLGHSLTPQI